MSQVKGGPGSDFTAAAKVATQIALALASKEIVLPEGTFLNVNVPMRPPVGISTTRLARRRYLDPIEVD